MKLVLSISVALLLALAAFAVGAPQPRGAHADSAAVRSAPTSTSTPARSKRRVCARRTQTRCIKVPRRAWRPKRARRQQGGPTYEKHGLGSALSPEAKVQGAVEWANQQVGRTDYAWFCQRFVEHAFGTQNQYSTAAAASSDLAPLRDQGNPAAAPAGALMFFARHASNRYFGHVGLSVGGGRMISALARVQVDDVGSSQYWRSLYLGWAPAPASWPGRPPSAPPAADGQEGSTTESPPVDRRAITSYDQMRPGAPHNGYFDAAWQPFKAESNTLTYIGATVGTSKLPAGQRVKHTMKMRVCTDPNCSSVLAEAHPEIVNYGNTEADVGDLGVQKGATYYLVWYQPAPVDGQGWVTYWWSGGDRIETSDQMQAVVKGFDR